MGIVLSLRKTSAVERIECTQKAGVTYAWA